MKKLILLTALMFIGMITNAQNYLGKSLTEVKSILNSKSIVYEEYVNGGAKYSVKYITDNEERIYVFNYADKCDLYVINFTSSDMVYNYAKLYTKQGYILQNTNEENVMWVFKKGDLSAACIYNEDKYSYSIIVQIK